MSGGSHNYVCYDIEEQLCGKMHDLELDEFMKDIAGLAHDLEWCTSSYNKTYGTGRARRSAGMKKVWKDRRTNNA